MRDADGPRAGARQRGGGGAISLAELAKGNWTAKRVDLVERFESRSKTTPIDPDWLTLQIANTLPKDAVVVNEGLTSSRYLTDLIPYRDRYGFHALASGGIGWGVAAAVGVALAQAPRQVCCYSGDGSAMYSIQALWTAAHLKLPITYVIANTGGYRIIKQRLLPSTATATSSAWTSPIRRSTSPRWPESLGMPAEHITEPSAVAPPYGALSTPAQAPGCRRRRPRLIPGRFARALVRLVIGILSLTGRG